MASLEQISKVSRWFRSLDHNSTVTKWNTGTPLPLSVPPFLSNRFTLSCCFSQSKPAFASCPVCCRWMCLQDSPPADCLKLRADLDQRLHLLQHRKILKQARQLSRKETSKKHPLGMPILQERPRVHLTEHLWSLESKLGKKKKSTSWSLGPRESFNQSWQWTTRQSHWKPSSITSTPHSTTHLKHLLFEDLSNLIKQMALRGR